MGCTIHCFKSKMVLKYSSAADSLLREIVSSSLVQIDETSVKVKGFSTPYVWVFANMDTVYYIFKPSREAEFLKEILKDFSGVLVSDFYPGYESLSCVQQKCLIHLMRDLRDCKEINTSIDLAFFVRIDCVIPVSVKCMFL